MNEIAIHFFQGKSLTESTFLNCTKSKVQMFLEDQIVDTSEKNLPILPKLPLSSFKKCWRFFHNFVAISEYINFNKHA